MNAEVKIICIIAVCSIFFFLIQQVNLKKKNRKHQIAIPFVSAIYTVAVTFLLMGYRDDLIQYINQLGLSEGEQPQFVQHIYTILPLENTDIALFNLVIVVSYFFVKAASLLALKLAVRKEENTVENSNQVYFYDSDNQVWCLRDEWTDFGRLMRVLSYVFLAATCIFLSLTCALGYDSPVWLYLSFAVPMIVTAEIANYFDGYIGSSLPHKVTGTDAYTQKISNFHKLRELYERMFPNELLFSTTSNEHLEKESDNEILEQMRNSDNLNERLVGNFFTNDENTHYDADALLACAHLMNHRNVVFFNPFYRDFDDYVALPLMHTLLSANKCLVVLGRNAALGDVKAWLNGIVQKYNSIDSLWRINTLSYKTPEVEIGILTSSALYDLNVLQANSEFLSEVKFVIFIEPSLILNTAQIALSIIGQKMNSGEKKANFCVFDKLTDGLVDTLSHVMKQEIVHVVAPPLPDGAYTALAWDADGDYLRQNLFDKQTRFLGNGVELSAVAIKNQIPKVSWFSESKTPIRDIEWIAMQSYPSLCKYMNLPAQQKSIQEKIRFAPCLWGAPREKDNFIITQDEFNNLFITLRAFLSRGISQSFINIFSENYLLRDYMRCNTRMFLSNPNAVPSLVPDYAKTERNVLFKLLLMMSIEEIEEADVQKELQLANVPTDSVVRTLDRLIAKYTKADGQVIFMRSEESENREVAPKTFYSVQKETFNRYFADSLKTAYYIVENEKEQEEYIDSKLYGLITQSVLPDQFLTYNGKYYRVKYVSSDSGVILRRASDLYNGNEYYRQLRNYTLLSVNETLTVKQVTDIEFSLLQCDFDVTTSGYLLLDSNNDLRKAKVIRYPSEANTEAFRRTYKNKNVLKVKLPDADDQTRFTLAILLQELFRSVYPSSWQYLAVLTAVPEDIDGVLNDMLYTVNLDVADDYIYIIEDSYIDLGLLSSIEKNLFRFLEILADFLEWHMEKMKEPEQKDPIPKGFNAASVEKEEKKQSAVSAWARRVRSLVTREKQEDEKDGMEIDLSSAETAARAHLESAEKPSKETPAASAKPTETPEPEMTKPETPPAESADSASETPFEPEEEEATEATASDAQPTVVSNPAETAESTEVSESAETPEPTEMAEAEVSAETTEPLAPDAVAPGAEAPVETAEAAETEVPAAAESAPAAESEAPDAQESDSVSAPTGKALQAPGGERITQALQSPAEKATVEPTEKAPDEPAEKAADEPAEKATDEPAEKAADESTEKTDAETVEASAQSVAPQVPANEADFAEAKVQPATEQAQADKVPADTVAAPQAQTTAPGASFAEHDFVPQGTDDELSSVDGTDIFDNDGTVEDYYLETQFEQLGFSPITQTRYQKTCYLKFGFEEIDARLKLDELMRYLRVHGCANNSLTKARKRDIIEKNLIDLNAENCCDFCGLPLSGVSFERLNDGRIRCNDCSSSTISSVEQFEQLFYQVLDMMQNVFGVEYKVPISVEMADAKTVGKKAGMLFTPSTGMAERVLGFARLMDGKYSLMIENGSPKLAAIDTMVHEMTHIWQYINWNDAQVAAVYHLPDANDQDAKAYNNLVTLIVYEGMATWASVQYLYQMGETSYAAKQEAYTRFRQDVYGIGFRLYADKYPLVKDGAMNKYTPFLEFPTIEPSEILEELSKLSSNENE